MCTYTLESLLLSRCRLFAVDCLSMCHITTIMSFSVLHCILHIHIVCVCVSSCTCLLVHTSVCVFVRWGCSYHPSSVLCLCLQRVRSGLHKNRAKIAAERGEEERALLARTQS